MAVVITCVNCKTKFDGLKGICPKCKTKVDTKTMKTIKKKKANKDTCLGLLIALALIIGLIYIVNEYGEGSEDIFKKQFKADGSHIGLVEITKSTMKKTSTFEHLKTTSWEKNYSKYIKMLYYVKNKNGVKVLKYITAKSDDYGKIISIVIVGTIDEEKAEEKLEKIKINTKKQKKVKQNILKGIKYKIISNETMFPHKRMVNILLKDKVRNEVLLAIAKKIKAMDTRDYKRTFISYYVVGLSRTAAWATSHYNTRLKIDIVGISFDDDAKLKKIQLPKGTVLGSWIFDGIKCRTTIYKKNGQYYCESCYADGSTSNKRLEKDDIIDNKYNQLNNHLKEYYKIKGKKLICGDQDGDFSYTTRQVK